MSRVYFHSLSGEAELLGAERAWLNQLCANVTAGIIASSGAHERLREIVNPQSYLRYPSAPGEFLRWKESVECAIRVGWDDQQLFMWRGQHLRIWEVTLNTACVVGGDALKLAARIHAQCEIHGYVEGPDRQWLAGMIDRGLDSRVFRRALSVPSAAARGSRVTRSLGWDQVTELLRSRDDEPVVMSYSVCDQFPNPDAAEWRLPDADDDHDDDYDQRCELWAALPLAEQWELGMTALRRRNAAGAGLQLCPAEWRDFRFGHTLSALDILADDYAQLLDDALGVTPQPARVAGPVGD